MTRFITLEEAIPIRWETLRVGYPLSSCIISQDTNPCVFHVGEEEAGRIIGTASFFPANLNARVGIGWQLRMMGVLPDWQGKGVGKNIFLFGAEHLKNHASTNYIWCNAREKAISFYEKCGLFVVSDFFEIEGIGRHKVMLLPLL